MAIRKVSFVSGEYYHIYNRGNSKQRIFHDKEDYFRFLDLLYLSNTSQKFNTYNIKKSSNIFNFNREKPLVAIGAYVLMPNHFHILITEVEENGISKFMQKISTAYSMYYNQKYQRTGGLFEGKFKASYISNDRYLKYLFSYIHLNPVKLIDKKWKEDGIKNKEEALKYLNNYFYSSYLDYIGKDRLHSSIISKKNFPDYFPSQKTFQKEIIDWISYQEDI